MSGPARFAACDTTDRAKLHGERAVRQAAQREAAACRKVIAELLRAVDSRIASERAGFDDDVWGERPNAARINARIDGLTSARDLIAEAVKRTAKRGPS